MVFLPWHKGEYFILKEGNSCQPQNGTIWGNIKQQPLSLVGTEGSRRELLERLDLRPQKIKFICKAVHQKELRNNCPELIHSLSRNWKGAIGVERTRGKT